MLQGTLQNSSNSNPRCCVLRLGRRLLKRCSMVQGLNPSLVTVTNELIKGKTLGKLQAASACGKVAFGLVFCQIG